MASITELRAELEERQSELRGELSKIEAAIQALSDGAVDEARARRGGKKPRRRRASADSRAGAAGAKGRGRPKPTREGRLLAAVGQAPGITVSQAAKKMKVSPSGLYSVRNTLVERGEVRVEGKGLYPTAK